MKENTLRTQNNEIKSLSFLQGKTTWCTNQKTSDLQLVKRKTEFPKNIKEVASEVSVRLFLIGQTIQTSFLCKASAASTRCFEPRCCCMKF